MWFCHDMKVSLGNTTRNRWKLKIFEFVTYITLILRCSFVRVLQEKFLLIKCSFGDFRSFFFSIFAPRLQLFGYLPHKMTPRIRPAWDTYFIRGRVYEVDVYNMWENMRRSIRYVYITKVRNVDVPMNHRFCNLISDLEWIRSLNPNFLPLWINIW